MHTNVIGCRGGRWREASLAKSSIKYVTVRLLCLCFIRGCDKIKVLGQSESGEDSVQAGIIVGHYT
jgi:hypothetical protein